MLRGQLLEIQTGIGRRLISPRRKMTAAIIAVTIIAADFMLILWDYYPHSIQGRGFLAVIGLLAFVRIVDGDIVSVGLRFIPVQGWWYWCRLALWIGLIIFVLMLIVGILLALTGREILPANTIQPDAIFPAFIRMCLFTPVLEEIIYRLIICVPLAVLLGPWWTVLASGLVFGGLHFAYGNPGIDNMFAGYVLAWAFLKSGSIAIPVVLHGLGNLFILIMNLAYWY